MTDAAVDDLNLNSGPDESKWGGQVFVVKFDDHNNQFKTDWIPSNH